MPSETIMEIMNSAPHYWRILIDTAQITTIHELQDLLKYHEENLMKDPNAHQYNLDWRIKVLEFKTNQWSSKMAKTFKAKTNFINQKKPPFKKKPIRAHAKFSQYKYPWNDKIKSSRKTPGEKGAQGCQHWEFESLGFQSCFWRKGWSKGRHVLSDLDSDTLRAFVAKKACVEEMDNKDNDRPTLEITNREEDPTDISDDEDFQTSLV